VVCEVARGRRPWKPSAVLALHRRRWRTSCSWGLCFDESVEGLTASGAFWNVERLRQGGYWLQPAERFADYRQLPAEKVSTSFGRPSGRARSRPRSTMLTCASGGPAHCRRNPSLS